MLSHLFNSKLFFICLLLVGISNIYGQESNAEEDVVYLKNGSIIRGEITERVIGSHIKVQILGGSVFVYDESEIETILKSPKVYTPTPVIYQTARESRKEFKRTTPISMRPKGIYNMFSYGFQPGPDQWSDVVPWVSLNWRTGYSFSQYVNVGVGVGIDSYMPGGTLPIYLDFHGEPGKQVRPMMFHYFLQAGYGIGAWSNWNFQNMEGGPMAHLGVGWKLNTRKRVEWLFTLGYKIQSLTYQQTDRWWDWPPPAPVDVTRTFMPLTMQVAVGF